MLYGRLRFRALERDGGVCAVCGCDTRKLGRALEAFVAVTDWTGRWRFRRRVLGELRQRLGFNTEGALAEVDHVVARHEGGGNELENLRTLCVPCHKQVTAGQARRRAHVRARERRRQLSR